MSELLEVRGLQVNGPRPLKDVSFSVPAGQVVAIYGADGAGKTTLMRALVNLKPHGGEVLLNGHDLKAKPDLVGKYVGVVHDHFCLPDMLRLPGVSGFMDSFYKSWDNKRFEHYTKKMHINPHRVFNTYTEDIKAQVSLAVAMCFDSRIIFIDLPINTINPAAMHNMMGVIREYVATVGKDRAVVFTTNSKENLEQMADLVYTLEDGSITGTEAHDVEAPGAKWLFSDVENYDGTRALYLSDDEYDSGSDISPYLRRSEDDDDDDSDTPIYRKRLHDERRAAEAAANAEKEDDEE